MQWGNPAQVAWNSAWLVAIVVVLIGMVRTPKSSFVDAHVSRLYLVLLLGLGFSYRGYGLSALPIAWFLWAQPAMRRARRSEAATPSP